MTKPTARIVKLIVAPVSFPVLKRLPVSKPINNTMTSMTTKKKGIVACFEVLFSWVEILHLTELFLWNFRFLL